MDLVEMAKGLGKDIPAEALEVIAGMTTKAQVLMYCRRFPIAAKTAPKATPKKTAPKPVKADEEE